MGWFVLVIGECRSWSSGATQSGGSAQASGEMHTASGAHLGGVCAAATPDMHLQLSDQQRWQSCAYPPARS